MTIIIASKMQHNAAIAIQLNLGNIFLYLLGK